MKFTLSFLHSKVASRIFILFIICALIPTLTLAILSFTQVTQQLHEQSRIQLRFATKATGLAIYERLLNLEDQMKLLASYMTFSSRDANPILPWDLTGNLTERFNGLALITGSGKQLPYIGRIHHPPLLTLREKEYIASGETLVTSQSNSDSPARIFMIRALHPNSKESGALWGEINPIYLWDLDDKAILPPMAELCVLDPSKNVLYRSSEIPASIPRQVAASIGLSSVGQLELKHERQQYVVGYWSIFLLPKFFTPTWTVMIAESKSDALSPTVHFTRVYPFVILMSLLVVLLLSIIQIRRSLIPLKRLQEGTLQIANRNFEGRVAIQSGDEFEDLATSFNAMASQLGKQFKTLTTMGEIDRQILSTLDTETIVDTLLTRMPEVFPCDCIAVTLMESDDRNRGKTYFKETKPGSKIRVEKTQLPVRLSERLRIREESFFIADEASPDDLSPLALAKPGIKSYLVLPIFTKEKLSAVIQLGYPARPEFILDDLVQARGLANQMAVALSNANLIKELNQLNWGALTALARAIDAKSSWTAGHSERVTKLALKIGKVLGFGPEELDVLHRGGLLHDTGKVGIPGILLNKPEKLTEEEMQLMKGHVQIGARILEPIAAYADTLPIVLEHHEWFDGTGYPCGLSGEAIHLNARIFALADVFDALTSNRPYRPAMDRKYGVESIKEGAGRQFDPKVVQAFLEVMAQEEREGEK